MEEEEEKQVYFSLKKKNTFNKYIDDPAQSIRWSSTFHFFFFWQIQQLTHSGTTQFWRFSKNDGRTENQTTHELYALSSWNYDCLFR